jgi:membrane protein YdbS with pleckstrin-like domain
MPVKAIIALIYAHRRRYLTMKYNTFEEELDAIRIGLYEETKDMTPEEEIAFIKAQVAPIHEKYGIRTVNEVKADKLINA